MAHISNFDQGKIRLSKICVEEILKYIRYRPPDAGHIYGVYEHIIDRNPHIGLGVFKINDHVKSSTIYIRGIEIFIQISSSYADMYEKSVFDVKYLRNDFQIILQKYTGQEVVEFNVKLFK